MISNTFHTLSTKTFSIHPVFKKIHPDLFLNYPIHIQQKNLKCVQNINSYLERLKKFENLIELSKSNLSIFHTELFLEKYDFSCYIIDELSHNIMDQVNQPKGVLKMEIKDVQEKSYVLHPDRRLLHSGILTVKDAKLIQKKLYQSMCEYFHILQLNEEWMTTEYETQRDHHSQQPLNHNRTHIYTMNEEKINQELHTIAFEEQLKNRMIKSSVFSAKNLKRHQRFLENEIDIFFHSHHIFIRGLNEIEQQEALVKLKSFLLYNGERLNFHSKGWNNVFIILYNASNTILPQGRLNKMKRYQIQIENENYYLEVPYPFQTGLFVEFLKQNLPMTSFSFDD
jgi:hypothetical protein